MSALWDTRKLSTQSSSILIKHVTVSKKKSKTNRICMQLGIFKQRPKTPTGTAGKREEANVYYGE